MHDLNAVRNSLIEFCRGMIVPIGGKYHRFGDVWDDKQHTLIEKLAASASAVLRGDVPPTKRFYVNASKGYGKDLIATLLLMYVLMFAERPTRAQLLANKQAQANEPLDIMRGILWADGPLNKLAAKVIEIQNYRVVSHRDTGRPESVIEVLTCDRLGSHGSRPDIVVCNEVSHIEDQQFFETAGDNLAKCPHGLGLYLSNAGFLGTWQHVWHEQVLTDPLFDCTIINTPAPWIDPEVLAYKARTDIPSRHQQYFYGAWVSPSGDVIPREQIERAIKLKGPQYDYRGQSYRYVAAADLSTTVNRSALTIFGVAADKPIVLADARCWSPQHYIDRAEFTHQLQTDIGILQGRFGIELIAFDQHESFLLTDLCHKLGIRGYLYYAAAKDFEEDRSNSTLKAEYLFRAFQEQWVEIYRHEQLILDLQATSVVTKAGGPKLEFGRDAEGGHADLADSFALGLLIALELKRSMRHNLEVYGDASGPREEVLTA